MSTYVIGDVQGCYSALRRLLEKIHFDDKKDVLWFVGDLINRGEDSLSTLRFIKSLGDRQKSVLGNHDLHLLATANGVRKPSKRDTFDAILKANDREELLDWVRHLPLLHIEGKNILVHAGIYPWWSLEIAKACAKEVEKTLRSEKYHDLLKDMYGNEPSQWDDHLQGIDRLRFIVNVFTRMRFCDTFGRMDLTYSGAPGSQPEELIPWFNLPMELDSSYTIYYGHWAALDGSTGISNRIALDTGCVWGNKLTAYCIENQSYYSVESK
jgi:bis(5'-nucleosyl)-tetraphosphatase (symmetrical)